MSKSKQLVIFQLKKKNAAEPREMSTHLIGSQHKPQTSKLNKLLPNTHPLKGVCIISLISFQKLLLWYFKILNK